ncbi:response regulator transcription factor [Streptomyces sp. WAC 00631]|uniref:response regulator transcription factor n=1 Tax=Streptomyces TaxID=1883 RepID=UPI000F7BAA27|nr:MULTISPECIES: response regulator transcription factor [Streptomyces]MCC3650237.1 response regulator transcription factor [Streptomyces sp. S07_1.15]MCC5036914.1 response regulator transcription factor [Streptomyces sp. WAC 00631]MCC9737950.1 response regulator transcription factor [Streptomyces sp. MNU89]WSQ74759.1 response regulator transcription factor [Streptomyces xinghaiensis]
MATTVLVVEDEKEIRELLRRYMERAGYAVVSTGSGAEAIRLLGDRGVDIAVLDLGLPDVDGSEVLREARERGGTPVVVLTARDAVEDRIRGLRLGADDYVTKPFSPTEVVLRVQAVLSRARHESGWSDSAATSYGHGRLLIDEDRHEAQMDGTKVELTPTEWGLLTALASVPGRVYSRYELVNRVRGYEFSGYERTIDSHVKNLRHKLGPAGTQVVETVMGVGYRLGLRRDT